MRTEVEMRCGWLAGRRGVMLTLLASVTFLMPALALAQGSVSPLQNRSPHDMLTSSPSSDSDILPSLSPKQKQSIVRANFEKSKNDAAEMAALAKELCKELSKPNVDVLSAEVVNRVEKIEKLAKKIRDETKGF
ncbi:MAG: hypothetical protein ACLQVL_21665 [Terriglobia bacterium]